MKNMLSAILLASIMGLMIFTGSCRKNDEILPAKSSVKIQNDVFQVSAPENPISEYKKSQPGTASDTIRLFEIPDGVVLEEEGRIRLLDIETEPIQSLPLIQD